MMPDYFFLFSYFFFLGTIVYRAFKNRISVVSVFSPSAQTALAFYHYIYMAVRILSCRCDSIECSRRNFWSICSYLGNNDFFPLCLRVIFSSKCINMSFYGIFLFMTANSISIFHSDDMKMETEIKRNKKTLLDQHGQYPIWMNQRQRKKLKAKREKKKGRSKAKAAKGLAW